jgi:hypothetical protein
MGRIEAIHIDPLRTFAGIHSIHNQRVASCFGHSPCSALHMMNAISEIIVGNFSTSINVMLTYGGTLIAENPDVLPLSAVLTLALLTAKMFRRKRSVSKSFQARDNFTPKRVGSLFKSQRTPVLKPCPNCAEQLPLSAIMCDTCDYNFLAERPGRRQVLLQPPNPLIYETHSKSL